MTFNSNKVNLPEIVTIKFRDKFKVRHMVKSKSLLFHIMINAKTRIYLVHIGFQCSESCIRQWPAS